MSLVSIPESCHSSRKTLQDAPESIISTERYIPLSQGQFAIVDEEDYGWLNQWKWHLRQNRNQCYASHGHYRIRKAVFLHSDLPFGFTKTEYLKKFPDVVATIAKADQKDAAFRDLPQ